MFINITIKQNDDQCDIIIDSEQIINEGLAILRKSGKLPKGTATNYYHSLLNQRLVSAHKTFNDEKIFDGDMLITVD